MYSRAIFLKERFTVFLVFFPLLPNTEKAAGAQNTVSKIYIVFEIIQGYKPLPTSSVYRTKVPALTAISQTGI